MLNPDDVQHVKDQLSRFTDEEPASLNTICIRCVGVLSVDGAYLTLMDPAGSQAGAGSSDWLAFVVQDLEFTLGEGPGVDSHKLGKAIFADKVHAREAWPHLWPMLRNLGVRTVSAFPLGFGDIKLGVIVTYRFDGTPFENQADFELVGHLVADQVLAMQSEVGSEVLAASLEVFDYRAVVHQATGMISVQLGCSLDEALVRLRALAFSSERPVAVVAGDLVSGQLRLDER